jgi:hypothetical protein
VRLWHPALLAAARHGLDSVASSEPVEITENEGPAVLADARRHKVVGLLDQAVADGVITTSSAFTGLLGEAAAEAAARSLFVERTLLQVHDLLSGAGIEHRFLKGSGVAHRFYPHPGLRTFIDVDVLIPVDQLTSAQAELARAGYTADPDIREGFLLRFGKSVTMRSPRMVEVDLHRTLAAPPFGVAATPDPLWERPAASIELGRHRVPVLDGVATFVHACVHESLSPRPRLAPLRDVAQIAAHVATRLEDVETLARALGVKACVAEAVDATEQHLGVRREAVHDRVAGWPIPPRERRWIAAYHGSTWRHVRAGIQGVPGLTAKATYLAAVMFPQPELAARRGGRRRRLAQAVRRAVRTPRR